MELEPILRPLLGGVLIGLGASLLLLLQGRVFGISGIFAGVLIPKAGDALWRIAAIAGLVCAGIVLLFVLPESLAVSTNASIWQFILAGLLVGFGTQLGSGCTSGHGVCGISRLLPRSLVATVTFILAGMATVALLRLFVGAP